MDIYSQESVHDVCRPRPMTGPGSLRARVKAPIVIFIPLFHSNALLGRTALLFTRVKAMFLPQTRPNVKTILFWLARNSFLLSGQGAGESHLELGLCDQMMDKTWGWVIIGWVHLELVQRSYLQRVNWGLLGTQYITGWSQGCSIWIGMLGLLRF